MSHKEILDSIFKNQPVKDINYGNFEKHARETETLYQFTQFLDKWVRGHPPLGFHNLMRKKLLKMYEQHIPDDI